MTLNTSSQDDTRQAAQSRGFIVPLIALVLVLLALTAGIVVVAILVTDRGGLATAVEVIRDLFVILLTFELLFIGAAFALLLIQVARFANLLQNEVRPIIESSSEAVNTVRGTVTFLSEQVVEPVMQVNAMLAGARQAINLVRDLGSLRDLAMAAAAQASKHDSSVSGPSGSETG